MSDLFVNVQLKNDPEYPTTETIRYDKFVAWLFKADTYKEMLHHAKGGCCEEAGELSSAIKRYITYGEPLTTPQKEDGRSLLEHIVEELGDLEFYVRAVMNQFALTEQQILQANADKLSKRYVNLRYSQEDALSRKDKQEKEQSNGNNVLPDSAC